MREKSSYYDRIVPVAAGCLAGAADALNNRWLPVSPLIPSPNPCHHYQVNRGRQNALCLHEVFFFFCASVQHLQRPIVGAQEFSESDSGCDGDATRVGWLCQFWTVLGIFTRKIF